jgi:hypothetical protein
MKINENKLKIGRKRLRERLQNDASPKRYKYTTKQSKGSKQA